MKIKILLVDDDKYIRELVGFYLRKERYEVIEAEDGEAAAAILKQEYVHLAIVDVLMPKMNGWQLCEIIRTDYDIPIILLTAKGEMEDKAKGFSAGTDDYVVKPFQPEELLFRVKALLRRYKIASKDLIQYGDLMIDRNAFEVSIGEEKLILPLKEFELLTQLASFPNRIFTREELVTIIWGQDYEGDDRTVDVHIKRLREKIMSKSKAAKIVTVRGVGYKFDVEKDKL